VTPPRRAKGIVLRGTGGVWQVRTETAETIPASLRGRLKQGEYDKLAVGDDVIVEQGAQDDAWSIVEILPRRSKLARRAPGGGPGERVVAANIDQVVVVFAIAEPEPHVRMLDRFLVIAEGNDLPSRVVVNKIELAPGPPTLFREYERIGYPVHYTSVTRGDGLLELKGVGVLRTVGGGKILVAERDVPRPQSPRGGHQPLGDEGAAHDGGSRSASTSRDGLCGGHARASRGGSMGPRCA
jgi:putative ribosome biogenesis GTPase RsgA